MIVYDDEHGKIEITPAAFPGCYFVTFNDDPEHYRSTSCVSLAEAYREADCIRQLRRDYF